MKSTASWVKHLLLLASLFLVAGVKAQSLQYTPYKDEAANLFYNQIFCDDLDLYKTHNQGPLTGSWQALFTQPVNLNSMQVLANSRSQETRVRILAFNALEQHHIKQKHKELLAVIIEVGLAHGLKTLAVYQDMRVRYISPNGKSNVWETHTPAVDAKIHKLFQEAQPIIEKIGPWGKPRLAPPVNGQMRLTLLVNDGLYFGEGTMAHLSRSPLAGPVITAATELLFALTRN